LVDGVELAAGVSVLAGVNVVSGVFETSGVLDPSGVVVKSGVTEALGVLEPSAVGDEAGVPDADGDDDGDGDGVVEGVGGTPCVEPLPGQISPTQTSFPTLFAMPATGCPTALRSSMPLTVACPPMLVMAERVSTSPAATTPLPISKVAPNKSPASTPPVSFPVFMALFSFDK